MTAEELEQESKRLAKLYAAMSEGELRQIGSEAQQLTEAARRALVEEISYRGLDVSLPQYAAVDEAELLDLVSIRTFDNLSEAMLAKGALESAGIECYLADDNMVRINWPGLVGFIKLRVKAEDADAANEILNQPAPKELE